jgi:hypothetical protein
LQNYFQDVGIVIRRMILVGLAARMEDMRNARNSLVRELNLERRRPLWRPIYRWKNNIKIDLKDTGCEDKDWFHVAQIMVL